MSAAAGLKSLPALYSENFEKAKIKIWQKK